MLPQFQEIPASIKRFPPEPVLTVTEALVALAAPVLVATAPSRVTAGAKLAVTVTAWAGIVNVVAGWVASPNVPAGAVQLTKRYPDAAVALILTSTPGA